MVRAAYLENRELAKKISERQRQIRVLARKVAKAMLLHGKALSVPPHKKKEEFNLGRWRLVRIENFQGYHITIYHAQKDVCRLFWEKTIEECEVAKWDTSHNWYGPLTVLLGNKKKIERQLKLDEGKDWATVRRRNRTARLKKETDALKKKAKRLRITA